MTQKDPVATIAAIIGLGGEGLLDDARSMAEAIADAIGLVPTCELADEQVERLTASLVRRMRDDASFRWSVADRHARTFSRADYDAWFQGKSPAVGDFCPVAVEDGGYRAIFEQVAGEYRDGPTLGFSLHILVDHTSDTWEEIEGGPWLLSWVNPCHRPGRWPAPIIAPHRAAHNRGFPQRGFRKGCELYDGLAGLAKGPLLFIPSSCYLSRPSLPTAGERATAHCATLRSPVRCPSSRRGECPNRRRRHSPPRPHPRSGCRWERCWPG